MAYRRVGGLAAAGFAPHNLTVEETHALHHARYPAPLDMRLSSGWRLSVGSVGISTIPVAHGTRWWEEIHAHRTTLMAEGARILAMEPAQWLRLGGVLPASTPAVAGAA
jgi:hypothetical protein